MPLSSPRLLLVTPPLTQLNTPYPATAYLTGFLRGRGYETVQADAGLALVLRLFSADGLRRVFTAVEAGAQAGLFGLSENAAHMLRRRASYERTIGPAVRFLQNKDLSLAARIAGGQWLPEAGRFGQVADLETAFGTMGITDQARHLATLYLEDLADLVRETVGPQFGLARYHERIALTATSFDPLHQELGRAPNLIDELLLETFAATFARARPDVVAFTVPFPGNLYGALRLAQWVKQHAPHVKTLMGGGYPNTELRDLREPRFFDYIDYLTLDDGEAPLLQLLAHWRGEVPEPDLQRTFLRTPAGEVAYRNGALTADIPHREVGAPNYDGLPLADYLSVLETLNPMHRLWSDGRWNKLTIAHGCYWKRCSFCDVTLDYIGRFEPAPAEILADRIDALVRQTGQTGFHFVDEAAPPVQLRDLALELLRRGTEISWWGNIRFEKTFTPDLCRLLAASGCIAVTGGLEVASDRLLTLMEKGVTVAQVARVAHAFTGAGVLVHAYLMYGFPTQTAQETIDSLEVVRQLFAAGVLQSGFWHRFAMTAHAPVGKNPAKYQVELIGPEPGGFAWTDLHHADPTGADHDRFGPGLAKALYNFMHGIGLDEPLHFWFADDGGARVPRRTVSSDLIETALTELPKPDAARVHQQLVWLHAAPQLTVGERRRKGRLQKVATLLLPLPAADEPVYFPPIVGQWLHDLLATLATDRFQTRSTLRDAAATYPAAAEWTWEALLISPPWRAVRGAGLLLV
ncbi:MAG: radical SAM protein [Hymenobacteraceae bacterium]|nr:radical SAM protein [Hymenobacteraceae bacterium]